MEGGKSLTTSFFSEQDSATCSWPDSSETDQTILREWENSFYAYEPNRSALLKLAPSKEDTLGSRESNMDLLNMVKHNLLVVSSHITIPHLFFFTNKAGIALHMAGTKSCLEKCPEKGIVYGTAFALQNSGINAISVAILSHKKITVIRGREHTLDLFSNWNCVCAPISIQGKTVGFLDLSFSSQAGLSFAVPMLINIVSTIEGKMKSYVRSFDAENISALLRSYSLTPRELEIGFAWLENQTTGEIAITLGIKEQTVRTFIKKI